MQFSLKKPGIAGFFIVLCSLTRSSKIRKSLDRQIKTGPEPPLVAGYDFPSHIQDSRGLLTL